METKDECESPASSYNKDSDTEKMAEMLKEMKEIDTNQQQLNSILELPEICIRKINIYESPIFTVKFNNSLLHLVLDTGATASLIASNYSQSHASWQELTWCSGRNTY